MASGSAAAPASTASTPTIQEVHEAPMSAEYPRTHGEMNSSAPSSMWQYSLVIDPGMANDQTLASTSSAPSTIIADIAAPFVGVHRVPMIR